MDDDNIISLNSFIYSLIRSNRSQRRAMLQSLLNMFDETGVCNLFLHDTCSVWASVVAISPLGEKAARSNSMWYDLTLTQVSLRVALVPPTSSCTVYRSLRNMALITLQLFKNIEPGGTLSRHLLCSQFTWILCIINNNNNYTNRNYSNNLFEYCMY